jgi:hypothetical protein
MNLLTDSGTVLGFTTLQAILTNPNFLEPFSLLTHLKIAIMMETIMKPFLITHQRDRPLGD